MHHVDHYLLTRLQRRFVISATVQTRLHRFGGIQSEVLSPPPPRRDYRCDASDGYLFAVSRLSPLKRFDLILKALAEPAAAGIKCVIGGEGAEMPALLKLRRQLDLDHRVEFVGRLDDAALLHYLSRCRAVVFPPFNEDYGFVTVEAFSCGKPMITCQDSGGPAKLVRNGESGWVTAPAPEALALPMRDVMENRLTAIRFGEAGARRAAELTWPGRIRSCCCERGDLRNAETETLNHGSTETKICIRVSVEAFVFQRRANSE